MKPKLPKKYYYAENALNTLERGLDIIKSFEKPKFNVEWDSVKEEFVVDRKIIMRPCHESI